MRAVLSIALAALAALVLAVPASAVERQVTALAVSFPPPGPTIDQGDTLMFVNQDPLPHDVTATQKGADGKPLFASRTITQGQSKVDNVEFLTTGSYPFVCTIHSNMTSTLTVTANGTPAVRPADTTKPTVKVAFPKQTLAGILKAKKVSVRVTLDEPANALATVTAKIGKKTLTLGTPKSTFKSATTRTLTVKLSSSAQKALAGADSVKLAAAGQATDAAGNVGRAKTAKFTASR
jgi:plastocyanin